jgi:hypothetical protein
MARDGNTTPAGPSAGIISAADRVSALIVTAAQLPFDVKTLCGWARATGVSLGALRGYCAAVELSPKRTLDFARLLRTFLRSAPGQWQPAASLTFSDPRHLQALLRRAALSRSTATTLTLKDFLSRQSLIPSSNHTLLLIIERLRPWLGLETRVATVGATPVA